MVTRLGVCNFNNLHFSGVVKIQLPLGTGDKFLIDEALIYDQSNQIMVSFPVEEVRSLFGENEYKIYRNCTLKAGVMEIDPRPLQFTPNW